MLSFFRKNKSNSPSVSDHGQECAQTICEEVDDLGVIMQLVLEDVEGASIGDAKAQAFAMSSGIPPLLYEGSLNNSRPEVDGPNGVKTFLDKKTLEYFPDSDKMAEFRLSATDYIMRRYKVGKYGKQ